MYHIGCKGNCHDEESGNAGETKNVTLVFHRAELLYDIKNYAYIEGHVWEDAPIHAGHTLAEIGEEGNVDRVNRILDTVHSAAVEMLYPYTKIEATDNEVYCDRLTTPDVYVIGMSVPATMSQSTLRLMSRLVHEFMVASVMGDWLSITHPEASRNWQEKAREAQQEINSIKPTRTGALRRPSHPF